ncbi:Dyp-type peroxidase [Nocardia stercoris]|uniref:Dyp-type peroxidase n=2 Tax=Nocardia stercoris TaxID=2483361 RepID=A0A3M2LLJ2_9NOCA|nr:Dyp-type peroxidase [Nocardia stercoris]
MAAASDIEPFWGAHQSGIVTATQRHAVLAAFDLYTDDRADIVEVLKRWTTLAAALTAGESAQVPVYQGKGVPTDAFAGATHQPTASDSLDAWQLGAQRLTVTVGFGPGLFTKNGKDRYGLAARRPAQLVDLPQFPGDQIDESASHGDLFVQVCADDPQVAFHAVRSLARIAPEVTTLRWTQIGFSPSDTGGTPRNLMGFKDGTVNSNGHPPADLDASVWAGDEGPQWMRGGSYLVFRRIRISLERWDRLDTAVQSRMVGRDKVSGAPLGGHHEFDAKNFDAKDAQGNPVIPMDSHVRLSAPENNGGAMMLRRAFSYNNGTTPFTERWPPWRQTLAYDAGLLFLAYQKDPRAAFVPVNQRLATSDAMSQFTTHTASGIYAVAPGARGPGDWIGSTLFA